jgi:nucleoid-associated protein YgaU
MIAGSRYASCTAVRGDDGVLRLEDRPPLTFRDLADNRTHTVVQGDTLWLLAGRYFAPVSRGCGWFWALAEFQPVPIVDPTLALEPGTILVIPSIATVDAYLRTEVSR